MLKLQIPTAEVYLPLLRPSRYKGAFGGRGCVHGGTLIETPNGKIPIKDFTGGEIHSVGGHGVEIVMAASPVVYQPEPLFRVTMESGVSVICAMGHKFLTPTSWGALSGIHVGHSVRTLAGSPTLLQKHYAVSPPESLLDVRRCFRIILGWLYHCSEYCRLCGVQSQMGLNTYRDVVQMLADVPPRNCHVSMHKDAQGTENRRIPLRSLPLPSTLVALLEAEAQSYASRGKHTDEISSVLLSVFFLCDQLSHENTALLLPGTELARQLLVLCTLQGQGEIPQTISDMLSLSVDDSSFNASLVDSCNHTHFTTTTPIKSIEYYGEECFYDIFVPFYNNYISDGIIHHNSGKSHCFAEMLIEDCLAEPGDSGEGMRAVCIREIQKDLAQSSKLLVETKLQSFNLGESDGFKTYEDRIKTPKDGIIIFKGMNNYNADSIKSLEGFKRAWWEEAQGASLMSLNMLRPTLRAARSELWFSWNPRLKTDPVDIMLRGDQIPTDAVVVESNWRDNPWLTHELKLERLDCLRQQPDQYDHIWEGGYVTVVAGAYYAKQLAQARAQGRICRVGPDPLMTTRVFCDIGGTGARSDAFSMWVAQFVGREIRVLDYYEAIGQPLATHLMWLKGRGYTPKSGTQIWLPHDGDTQDRVFDVSFESAFHDAGYTVTVVPNQGKGAAKLRIEAMRRLFPIMWFNAPEGADHETQPTTAAGLAALGWYHEKIDPDRNIGLGPVHDWASHACDAAGLMCVAYEEPSIHTTESWRSGRPNTGYRPTR